LNDTDAAFASFEQKWLAANPEQVMVAPFVAPAARLRVAAFGCLVHELESAAYEIDEPDVASAKLAWWAQELEVAASGHARHPVTHALFDDAARAADRSLWQALAIGALKQVEAHACASLDELIEQREPFSLAIADAESALFLAGAANIDANAALWTLSALLRALRFIGSAPEESPNDQAQATSASQRPPRSHERLPLPLDLLARHGLTRADLATASAARDSLFKEYLGALRFEIVGAQGVASARTLTQRVRVRSDIALIERALKAADTAGGIASRPPVGRLRGLFNAWREARAIARGA